MTMRVRCTQYPAKERKNRVQINTCTCTYVQSYKMNAFYTANS